MIKTLKNEYKSVVFDLFRQFRRAIEQKYVVLNSIYNMITGNVSAVRFFETVFSMSKEKNKKLLRSLFNENKRQVRNKLVKGTRANQSHLYPCSRVIISTMYTTSSSMENIAL